MLDWLQTFLAENQFASGGILITALGIGAAYARSLPSFIHGKLLNFFTIVVTLDHRTAPFNAIVWWLGREFQKSKHRTRLKLENWGNWQMGEGAHWIFKNRVPIKFNRNRMEKESGDHTETLSIRFYTRNKDFVNNLLEQIRKEKEEDETKESDPTLCVPSGSFWEHFMKIRPRSSNTVYLEDGKFEEIIEDIGKFYESKEDYAKKGIPYHRGYLFYGPPGTGKSSTIVALATRLKKNLYFLDLNKVNPSYLLSLINSSRFGILVIEDIDCMPTVQRREDTSKLEEPSQIISKISLNDLLNSLDGVTSPDQYVLIATTNHPEKIDPALKRPGRIDKMIEFGYLKSCQTEKMIGNFYPNIDQYTKHRIIEEVGEGTTSPAFLQEIFMSSGEASEALSKLREFNRTKVVNSYVNGSSRVNI